MFLSPPCVFSQHATIPHFGSLPPKQEVHIGHPDEIPDFVKKGTAFYRPILGDKVTVTSGVRQITTTYEIKEWQEVFPCGWLDPEEQLGRIIPKDQSFILYVSKSRKEAQKLAMLFSISKKDFAEAVLNQRTLSSPKDFEAIQSISNNYINHLTPIVFIPAVRGGFVARGLYWNTSK